MRYLLALTAVIAVTSTASALFSGKKETNKAVESSKTQVLTKAEGKHNKQIAVMDRNKINEDSKAAKSLNQQMEAVRKKTQLDIDQREEKLRAQEREIEKSKSKLSPEDFEAEQRKFSEEVRKLQESVATTNQELQIALQQAIQEFQGKLHSVKEAYAKANGYDVVLAGSACEYVNTDQIPDITDDIIKALDAQMPTLKLRLKSGKTV